MLKKNVNFKITRYIPYNIDTCVAIVKEVENYPKFLENVRKVQVINHVSDQNTLGHDKNFTDMIEYKVYHNYGLLGQQEWVDYSLKKTTKDNTKTIIINGYNSGYAKKIDYKWVFHELSNDKTKIELELDLLLNSELYYPMIMTFKDYVMEKNIMQFTSRIHQVSKE